jgi:hypothetical protein
VDNNYEWQKHHTNERIKARLKESELHRMVKPRNDRTPLSFPQKMESLFAIVVAIVIWLFLS